MTNEALLQTLERSGLIAADVLAALRRQAASGVEPAALVRQLIRDGHLTQAQAAKLLAPQQRPHNATIEIDPDEELEVIDEYVDDAPAAAVGGEIGDDLEVIPDNEEDDLLPPPPPQSKPRPAPVRGEPVTRAIDDDLGLAPVNEDSLLDSPLASAPSAGAAGKKASKGKPGRKRRMWKNEVPAATPELDDQVDDLLGDVKPDAGGGASLRTRPARRAARKEDRNVWNSPLMLFGGGALLMMIVIAGIILVVLKKQSGDDALQMAEEDFKHANYAGAITKFDEFIVKYPKHNAISTVKVHRGLAEMRQAAESKSDMAAALATTKRVLEQISQETEFAAAQDHLKDTLPALAEGLAAAGRDKPSRELVADTRESVALVEKYLPSTTYPAQRMREVENSATLTERRLDREKALDEGLEKMQQAVAAGNTIEAYAVRRGMLQVYPELIDDKKLLAALEAVAEAQRTTVKFVEDARPSSTEDVPSPALVSTALTSTIGAAAPVDEAEPATVLDSGTVYALDPRTGRPRWRRFVGFETTAPAQIVNTASGPAALTLDAAAGGIVLVDAATGKLRWRQTIEDAQPIAPVVIRDRVAVATKGGRLLLLELETGKSLGYISLPQPLAVGPAVGPREQVYYQLAAQGNLYVLAADGSGCREVYYVGHEAGSVAVAPLVVGRYVIVVENNGIEDSVLRVLLADEQGLKLKPIDETPLRGHVMSTPVVSGRVLIVATDRGAIYTFELGAADSGKVLTKLANKPADEKPPVIPHIAVRGTDLWVSSYGVTRYNIQAARGAMTPIWINDDQSKVLERPRIAGSALIYAMRGERNPGVIFTAINSGDSSRFWETRLAVPLAASPVISADGSKAVCITTAGALYEVPAAGLAGRKLIDAPVASINEKLALPQNQPLVQLADGRCVFAMSAPDAATPQPDVLIYEPQAPDIKLRRQRLPQPAAAYPVAFAGGLLLPARIGQVLVIDPSTGRSLVDPFQPVVEVGRDVAWTEPVAIDDKQALITDGATTLYRLEVTGAPRPQLTAGAKATLTNPIVSPIAVAGDYAYAVDSAYRLLSFHLPDLSPGKDWALDAHPQWGPRGVGDMVLVSTLTGQTTCGTRTGEMAWQVPLGTNLLTGTPIVSRGAIVAATKSGTIYRLALDSGKALTEVSLKQPVALGPVSWHERLLFAGGDGTLHIVAEPK